MNNDSSKLFLYSKLKSDIKLVEYLKSEKKFKNRQLLTKFRLSDHNFEIEPSYYKNIPRNQRQLQLVLIIDHDSFNIFHLKPELLFSLLSVFFPNCKRVCVCLLGVKEFFPEFGSAFLFSPYFASSPI